MATDPPAAPIRVVLGSASPGRLRVLRAAGIDPLVRVSDVDEDAVATGLGPDASPTAVVLALAEAKASTVADRLSAEPDAPRDAVVIGCDSMLFFEDQLIGKPHVPDVARAQWRSVRGRSGNLLTGHCVLRLVDGVVTDRAAAAASTTVRFADVDDSVIDAYVGSGEPLEVAGAFTIDGLGGWLIDGIDGDPSAVIGIGLPLVRRLFDEVGVSLTDLWSTQGR